MPTPRKQDIAERAEAYLAARASVTVGAPMPAARPLELVVDDETRRIERAPEPLIPDAAEMADEQHLAATRRLAEDTSRYARFPFPDVDALVGALAPEEMWFLLGRTGHGKSLFLQTACDHFVAEQRRRVLYIGTEQNPEILKIKWACLRAGVFPKLVLKPTKEQRAGMDYHLAMDRVAEELEYVRQLGRDRYAMFATSKYINRPELKRWVTGAVKQYGCELVIVDHIDEVDHGDGRNSRHENTETLNLIQLLAKTHHIPFLIASQCRRLQDRGMLFTPPTLEDLAENNNKERKASYVLTVWRPLRRGVTKKDIAAVRLGQANESALYEPDTMGFKVLKTREDTGELGKMCRLHVNHGRVEHLAEKDRYATTPMGDGPRP